MITSVRPAIRPALRRSVRSPGLAFWNFRNGGAFPDLTYANPVAGSRARDTLSDVPSGQARTSGMGLLSEPQSACKAIGPNLSVLGFDVTTNNATADVTPIGFLPAALAADLPRVDPKGRVASVYRLRPSGGEPHEVDFTGPVGNLNKHTTSAFFGGSGTYRFGLTGTVGGNRTAGDAWDRPEETATPAAISAAFRVVLQAGADVYVFGYQPEEQIVQTSTIETLGSAVTRLGDRVLVSNADIGLPRFPVITVVDFYKFMPASSAFDVIWSIDSGGGTPGTFLALLYDTNGRVGLSDGTASNDIYTSGVVANDTWHRAAIGFDGTNYAWALDGTFIGQKSYTPPAGYLNTRFGSGVGGTGRQIGGYIGALGYQERQYTQALLEQLSA